MKHKRPVPPLFQNRPVPPCSPPMFQNDLKMKMRDKLNKKKINLKK